MTGSSIGIRGAAVAAAALLAASCGGGDSGAGTTTAAGTSTTPPAATTFRDPAGDVSGGAGPDITAVTVSSTSDDVAFAVRFAAAPPLATSAAEGWSDMLLVGIDVPPFGPAPQPPTQWLGLDYVAGLHGAQDAVRVRSMAPGADTTAPGPVVHLPATRQGAVLRFAIPRRLLGQPAAIRFQAAAGREGGPGAGGGDLAPDAGTFHVQLPG